MQRQQRAKAARGGALTDCSCTELWFPSTLPPRWCPGCAGIKPGKKGAGDFARVLLEVGGRARRGQTLLSIYTRPMAVGASVAGCSAC